LLADLIGEGLASAFDIQVQPGLELSSLHVLSRAEERRLWRANPLLGDAGLYGQWFFWGGGVPPLAGFQIGYDIVLDYLALHPKATSASIIDLPSRRILTGLDYAP
jgi:uncharacterized protein YjaZ